MRFEVEDFPRPDGTVLALRRHAAEGGTKGVVAVLHGMAEHSGRYARFAGALAQSGYATLAHDHRGHGATRAPGASLGHFGTGGLEGVLDDVEAVVAEARSAHPDVPVTLFGHSMGCILALASSVRRPGLSDRLALWNSGVETGALAIVFGGILRVQQAFLGSDVPSDLARKATFETWNRKFAPNRTEFDWLSRDTAEVDRYVADPLCGFPVSIGVWRAVLAAIRMGADDARLDRLPKDLPVHLLAGNEDPCTESGEATANLARRMEAAGMSDVTLIRLDGTRHESLNEVNREKTTARFIAWLDAH